MNDYELKQEARRERLERASARAGREASSQFNRARQVIAGIPPGQPILVGHHSERRHRRDLDKHDRAMRAGCDAQQRAQDLASKAAAVGTGGVSSDDPDAVIKLREQLAQHQAERDEMKRVNSAWRKGGAAGLVAAGFSQEGADRIAAQVATAYSWEKQPYPSWQLSNLGANIRRIEQRIKDLETRPETPERAPIDTDRWSLFDNAEINRTCFRTPAKPSEAIRKLLKSSGFRWSPTERAWLRMRSHGAWYAGTQVGKAVDAEVISNV